MQTMIQFTKGLDHGIYYNSTEENYETICKEIDCFEKIPKDTPVKMFYDIDYYNPEYEYDIAIYAIDKVIDIAKNAITNMIQYCHPEFVPDFCVCNSSSPSFIDHSSKKEKWKISLHLIVNNMVALSSVQKDNIGYLNSWVNDYTDWKDYLGDSNKLFDESIYGNCKFRSVYGSKPNEKRPLIILEGDFNKSVLSGFIPTDAVVCGFPRIEKETSQYKTIENATELNSEQYEIIKNYIDIGCFADVCPSGCQKIWADTACKLKTAFGEKKGFQLFELLTLRDGTPNKQKEYVSLYDRHIDVKENNPEKAFNALMKIVRKNQIYLDLETAKKLQKDEERKLLTQKIRELKEQKEIEKELQKKQKSELKELQIKQKEFEKEEQKTEKKTKSCIKFNLNKVDDSIVIPLDAIQQKKYDLYLKQAQVILSTSSATDYDIAFAWKELYGSNFKCVDVKNKIWYHFTNKWVRDETGCEIRLLLSGEFHFFTNKYYFELMDEMTNNNITENRSDFLQTQSLKMGKFAEKIKRSGDKSNIYKEIQDLCYDDKFVDLLDTKEHLLGFDNGVYDLNVMKFRPYEVDDYISLSCGYNFKEHNLIKSIEMDILLRKILPDIKTRQLVMEILSCGLTGKAIEKFIIFNGGGRNGKGLIDELIELVLGEYAYIYAPVCLLTEKDKTGPNPEKVKINKKRLVIMKEPEENQNLKNDRIKEITGGGNISGRDLYAGKNECRINLNLILIMEANKVPILDGEAEYADRERIIDILFPNRFTSKPEEVDEPNNVFLGDVKYKTIEWKEEHKLAMLHMMIEAYKKFKARNYVFKIPEDVKLRTETYLNKSFPILPIFYEHYEKCEGSIVKMKDVGKILQGSTAYNNFDKKQKRKYNYAYICDFFKTNKLFNNSYKDDKKTINKITYETRLMGWKLISDNEDDGIDE